MCLQWCHVQNFLIDNDLPCALWCAEKVRWAHDDKRCEDCRHHQPIFGAPRGRCALTKEITPLAGNCCHYDAVIQTRETVLLRLGETVPPALLRAHGIRTVDELFLVVDSAPDLPPGSPQDGIALDHEFLSVPLVYGVRALCWENALYGRDELNWRQEAV